jgi:hypothetical protein
MVLKQSFWLAQMQILTACDSPSMLHGSGSIQALMPQLTGGLPMCWPSSGLFIGSLQCKPARMLPSQQHISRKITDGTHERWHRATLP